MIPEYPSVTIIIRSCYITPSRITLHMMNFTVSCGYYSIWTFISCRFVLIVELIKVFCCGIFYITDTVLAELQGWPLLISKSAIGHSSELVALASKPHNLYTKDSLQYCLTSPQPSKCTFHTSFCCKILYNFHLFFTLAIFPAYLSILDISVCNSTG